MAKLSVNVNKIATLRNSRGKDVPNVVGVARFLERLGADGITVHPRPDGRHIRTQDVLDLKDVLQTELNVEGYPSEEFLSLMERVRPDQVTLVPDPPDALTSNAGWTWEAGSDILPAACERLRGLNLRISLFVDPFRCGEEDIMRFKELGVHRLELYTERYADDFSTERQAETLKTYQDFARLSLKAGIGLNAGHDLTSRNVRTLLEAIPEIEEVSIGHAFVVDSLQWGLAETLSEYRGAVDLSKPFKPRTPEENFYGRR